MDTQYETQINEEGAVLIADLWLYLKRLVVMVAVVRIILLLAGVL